MTSAEGMRNDAEERAQAVPLTQVVVHSLGQEDAVTDAAAQLASAARHGSDGPVEIVFDPAGRVSPQWGTIFSNLLARRSGRHPLRVALPTNAASRRQLARAGVLFALARYPWLDETSLSNADREMLAPWRLNWTPASGEALSLFEFGNVLDGTEEPEELDRRFVVFLNPDRSSGFDTEHRVVVHPWLRRLVPQINDGRRPSGTALREVSLSISELLDNVQRHADLPHGGLSSVSVFVTQGHPDRLYISVTDTGIGMQASLRKNYPKLDETPEELLARPFDGRLPGRERDRGRGLHRLGDIVDRYAGSLFMATGSADHETFVVERSARSTEVSKKTLGVRGTVVVVKLPLPALTEPDPGLGTNPLLSSGSEPC